MPHTTPLKSRSSIAPQASNPASTIRMRSQATRRARVREVGAVAGGVARLLLARRDVAHGDDGRGQGGACGVGDDAVNDDAGGKRRRAGGQGRQRHDQDLAAEHAVARKHEERGDEREPEHRHTEQHPGRHERQQQHEDVVAVIVNAQLGEVGPGRPLAPLLLLSAAPVMRVVHICVHAFAHPHDAHGHDDHHAHCSAVQFGRAGAAAEHLRRALAGP